MTEDNSESPKITRRGFVAGLTGAAGLVATAKLGERVLTPIVQDIPLSPKPLPDEIKNMANDLDELDAQDFLKGDDHVPHVPWLIDNPTSPAIIEVKDNIPGKELLERVCSIPLRIANAPERGIDYSTFDTIVATSIRNPKRVEAEKAYAQSVGENLGMIDRGIGVFSDIDLKQSLIAKRYKLRLSGKESKLKPIPTKLAQWAEARNIHPEAVGICLDAYTQAQEVITKLQEKKDGFWPEPGYHKVYIPTNTSQLDISFSPKPISAVDTMINIGGMAELACQETSLAYPSIAEFDTTSKIDPDKPAQKFKQGDKRPLRYAFVNTGIAASVDVVDKRKFPTAVNDLVAICDELYKQSGIRIDPKNLPGSNPTKTDKGGAIGLQFMSPNARWLMQAMKEVNYYFNPLDPTSAIVGGWVFLALRQDLLPKAGEVEFRSGYLNGSEFSKSRENALYKWNGSEKEAFLIQSSTNSFADSFPDLKPDQIKY